MYPNLLGQKTYRQLTDEKMGEIIGISRNAYGQKIKSGRFTPEECKLYCIYFKKPFNYLFATDEEIGAHESNYNVEFLSTDKSTVKDVQLITV